MDKVRIGVIGIGNMGTGHCKNIQEGKIEGAELTAICDIDDKVLEKIDGVKKYKTSTEIIESGDVDAVLIATPHYDHTTIGIEALEKGLHVLVEKPISVHKKDCEKLIAAHKNDDQVFAAMFNQRTDPSYRKIKQILESGELGQIVRVNWIITTWFRTQTYYNSGTWRATWEGEGGGVLLNQCPHQLDLFQWFFGMPSKVRGFCKFGHRHDIEVEDEVTAYMDFENGSSAVFVTSTGEAPGSNRLEVAGENGKLIFEGGKISYTKNEESMLEFSNTTSKTFAKPDTWDISIPVSGQGGQHVEIMQNFTDAILNGEELIAPAKEGVKSVHLGNAMLYSSALGEPIEMPVDSDKFEDYLQKLIDESDYEKEVSENVETDFGKSFQ